jgi:NADP-dependent 3-hydroxy acid dehydrogenase YdfG
MSKIVLITGASSGFGRLTAEALARDGHAIFA